MPTGSYRDLIVWQKAVELVKELYLTTSCFPKEEMFGITSQIRRSAVSIPSNIAEDYGRLSKGDYSHFLKIARGSASELETEIIIASEIGFLTTDSFELLLFRTEEIQKMLYSLIRSLQESNR